MNTPREILLARHQAAEPKLDRIRHEAVQVAADVSRRNARVRELTFAATVARALAIPFHELIWPCRRTWGALAAVWVAILAFNLTQAERGPMAVARSAAWQAEARMAFVEQQRLLAELIGPPPPPAPPTEPPRRVTPQPRSERRAAWTMV